MALEFITSFKEMMSTIFYAIVSKLETFLPLTSTAEKVMFMVFTIGVIYILLVDWKKWLKLLAIMVIAGLMATLLLT